MKRYLCRIESHPDYPAGKIPCAAWYPVVTVREKGNEMSEAREMRKAAYIFSQSVCALCELEAMKAANERRRARAEADAYPEDALAGIIDKYAIDTNSVIAYFRE